MADIDINMPKENKYGQQIMNISESGQIICVHIHTTKMHMHVKFEVSITNILVVIHINVAKEQIWLPNSECFR